MRRVADQSGAIMDWYRPSLLFFIVTTYVLSGIDAVLTLTLLELRVATEANPIMHLLLAENVRLFAGVKAFVTGIGLMWLAAYSNHFILAYVRVEYVIYFLFTMYSLLVVYEIHMLQLAEAAGWPD